MRRNRLILANNFNQQCGEAEELPDMVVEPAEVTLLDHFQHLYWQAGEHALCPPGMATSFV